MSKPGLLLSTRLHSFEELSSKAFSWIADFRQLDRESFEPKILQLLGSSVLLSEVKFGCHVSQSGETPAGMRTFGIPEADSTDFRWFGRQIDREVLLVFPTDRTIDAQTRPGFHVKSFSIPEERLVRFLEGNELPSIDQILSGHEIAIKAPAILLNRLRRQLDGLKYAVKNLSGSSMRYVLNELEESVLWSLHGILAQCEPISSIRKSRGSQKLQLALDYIHQNHQSLIRVSDLSALTGISERAVHDAFKRELGITPKAYLKGFHLSRVHADLWNTDPQQEKVKTIVNRWGLSHLSQFAADYKRIYGELPSETLAKKS